MTTPSTHSKQNPKPKAIAIWLFFCAFMVFAMMVIGAITRLTESGLSMVEWRPLIGALPPLNEAEWNRVFELYQQTPEYQKKNAWMGIADFKNIFFWEWFHRLWGRLIGVAFALPLIWFWLRRNIPAGYGLKLFGLLILGGMQGVMGWYMVKSGLVDMPAVSHYRLAAHLSLAMLIFALLILTALSVLGTKGKPSKVLYAHGWLALLALVLTIFWGAFTAGLDAGLLYNDSFPHMGGALIPPDFHQYPQIWKNALENPSGVQFIHRWLAMLSVLLIGGLWAHATLIKRHSFGAMHALGVMVCVQFTLGLVTLYTNVAIHPAAAHQAGAATLLGLLVTNLYILRPLKIK
jgi:cytochrome c oxidase assembly protein subunit 15